MLTNIAILLLLTTIFTIDLMVPLTISSAAPYIGVVLITLWSKDNLATIITAITCSILSAIGFYLSPAGGSFIDNIINRCLTVIGIWLVAMLVIYKKRDSKKISYEKDRLKSILAASLDPLIVANSQGIIQNVSDSVKTIFGWDPAELTHQNLSVLMPEPYKSEHDGYLEKYRKTKKTNILGETRELHAERKNGDIFPCEVSLGKVTLPYGDEILFTGIIKDISTRKNLEKNIYKLTIVDELTQIYNRRYFNDHLNSEWNRMKRDALPISLAMIDIDYFKKYNDLLGHQTGDECLSNVAKSISQTVERAGDFVARYGGEEFVILLPGSNKTNVMIIAENIRNKVYNLNMHHPGSDIQNRVTISVGAVTLIPSDSLHPNDLIHQADKALYMAKEQGRNCVVFYH